MRSLAEWLLALGVFAGLVWVATPVVRRLAPPAASGVTLVESILPALPGGIPPGAQPVPMVMLLDGTVLRLGMLESTLGQPALARLVTGQRLVEPGVLDDRLVVPFKSEDTHFWAVLDRTEIGRERQVTAIYVR